jgi:PAS domain S-box-containing protein
LAGREAGRFMTPPGFAGHPGPTVSARQPTAAAAALAAIESAGSNPIVQGFPRGAIVAFDHHLRYLAAGGLGLADVGLSREMLEGNTIFEVFPPEVVAVIEPHYRLALAGEESSVDVPYQGRIFLLRLGPLRAADGQIVAGMGFTQDVTIARRRERELSESETRFRVAFEHAPIAKALIGVDFRYELVNPAMCAFTGYTESELVGRSMVDIAHPGDIDADLAAMAGLLANRQVTYSMDKRFRTATGGVVWGAKSATLVRREDGTPLHFIAQIQDITARKIDEQALLDERRRLRDAESIGRVGSWDLDLETGSITWSEGLFDLWGLDATSFDGSFDAARDQIHPDDRAELDSAMQECRNTGAPFRLRYRINRASDHEQRWIDVRGAAAVENGRIVRIGGALADVTEQVQAYAEVAEAQAFQQAVVGASPDIIAVWDYTTQTSVWTNRSIPGMLGYNSQDIADMGPSRRKLVFSGDRERFETALQVAHEATTDDVVEVDYRMVQKDGALRWFAQRSAPIARDKNGRVTRIMGVVRDTSVEKAARAALQESEARFRQLAESINVAFVLRRLDPPAFLYISPGYRQIYGYDPMAENEDPFTAIRRVVHPEDWDQVDTTYWAQARDGEAVQSEFRIVRPDGEVRWIRATSAPVIDPDGVVRRTASTGEDITERKLAQAAQLSAENLARAAALKTQFMSRMSHELRTPLNAVLGFGQLLELDDDLTGGQRNAVQHILQGGRHLVDLVDDILDITLIQGGRLPLTSEAVRIDLVLGQCLQEVTPAAAELGVALHYHPAVTDVVVRADPRRLSQVVVTLLSNAIKYNRPEGRVDLTYLVTNDAQLHIVVNDTGVGIGIQDLPRLFVPFDRLDAPASGIEGTGLGLTLARDLMTAMGGSLHAASVDGIGSTFTASIPLADVAG